MSKTTKRVRWTNEPDLEQALEFGYGLLPDWIIRKHIPISPMAEGERRPGKISYGLGPYGYDARLGDSFKMFSSCLGYPTVDPKKVDPRAFAQAVVETDASTGDRYCLIPPHSYILGETFEEFDVPRDVSVICLGKSTYARCGLHVNVTPLEAEWCGRVTLEISNSSPLPTRIYVGEGICQFLFFLCARECERSYKDREGIYQAQTGLTLARVRPLEENLNDGEK